MARVRRRFVGAIVADGIITSYLVLAALLHAIASERRDHVDERPEMAPFLAHLGHGFVAIVGLAGIWLPGASFSSRALRVIAGASFLGDALALSMHVSSLTVARLADECAVYALLAILLAVSSLNVYWTSTCELATFVGVAANVEQQRR